MLYEIAKAIKEKLINLGIFKQVLLSTTESTIYKYPAAIVYLIRDTKLDDKPSVRRNIKWGITVIVKSTVEENAAEEIYGILDKVRDEFSNWVPREYGMQPATVTGIEFVEWQNALMVYMVNIEMRALTETFKP